MDTIQERLVVKPPFSKQEMKKAFVTLSVARKKRNTKKHEGVIKAN